MRKIELRPAFVFTCDDCGTDQFEHAIVPEFSEEELQELLLEHGIDENETGLFLESPKTVKCDVCGAEFTTEDYDSEQF
jgi:ribosomal protein S27E